MSCQPTPFATLMVHAPHLTLLFHVSTCAIHITLFNLQCVDRAWQRPLTTRGCPSARAWPLGAPLIKPPASISRKPESEVGRVGRSPRGASDSIGLELMTVLAVGRSCFPSSAHGALSG